MRLILLGCAVAFCAGMGCAPADRAAPEYAVSWGHRLEGVPCFTFYTDDDAPLFGDQAAVIEVDHRVGLPFHLYLKNHTGRDTLVSEFGDAWGEGGIEWKLRTVAPRYDPESKSDPITTSGRLWNSGLWDPPELILYRELPVLPDDAGVPNKNWYWRHEIAGHIPLRGLVPSWEYADLTINLHLLYYVPGYEEKRRVSVRRCARLVYQGTTQDGKVRIQYIPLPDFPKNPATPAS